MKPLFFIGVVGYFFLSFSSSLYAATSCPDSCLDTCLIPPQGAPICVDPAAKESEGDKPWFTGPGSYNANVTMATLGGTPENSKFFVTDASVFMPPLPGESSMLVHFGDTAYKNAGGTYERILRECTGVNILQISDYCNGKLYEDHKDVGTYMCKDYNSFFRRGSALSAELPLVADAVSTCIDTCPGICSSKMLTEKNVFCKFLAEQSLATWWPANVVFYDGHYTIINDSLKIELGAQRRSFEPSPVLNPSRNTIEAEANRTDHVGVYVSQGVDLCRENDENTDWESCKKVRYYLTNTIAWGDKAEGDEKLRHLYKQLGVGFYKLDHAPEAPTVSSLLGCRLSYTNTAATTSFCKGQDVVRPTGSDPSSKAPLPPNPNVLWYAGSKFTDTAIITPDDYPISLFPAKAVTRLPYAYFLGKGEVCTNSSGCADDIPYAQYKPDVYLARIPAKESALKAGEAEYFAGIDELGYSIWQKHAASAPENDGYAHARSIYDLQSAVVVPKSVTYYAPYGELWLATDGQLNAGGLFFSSVDGLHWTYRAMEKGYDDPLTWINKCNFYKDAIENAQVYGHYWVPAGTPGLETSSYLFYGYSRWLSYYGFKKLPPDQSFPSYNTRLVKFKVPAPIPYLAPHDGYIETKEAYVDNGGALRTQSNVVALPFKGFFNDGTSANPGTKRNIVVQWCKCAPTMTEAECKANTCVPGSEFISTTLFNDPGWHLGTYELATVNPVQNKVQGCHDSLFNPDGKSVGEVLCDVAFKTNSASKDGQPTVPVWNWATDTNTTKGNSANVILRFSYYDVSQAKQATDYVTDVKTQLLNHLAKAPFPKADVAENWNTTKMLKLTYADEPMRWIAFPRWKYDLSLLRMAWPYYFLQFISKADGSKSMAIGKYDPFTSEVLVASAFTFTSDTPKNLQVLPENFSIAGTKPVNGSGKYYLYGTNKTATDLPIIYESVTDTTTGAIQWRPHTVHSADNGGVVTHVVSLPSPVLIVDPMVANTVYLLTTGKASVSRKSATEPNFIYKLTTDGGRKSATDGSVSWAPVVVSPQVLVSLQHATVVDESPRTKLIIGGSIVMSNGSKEYQSTIYRLDLDKLAAAESDGNTAWLTTIGHLPEGRSNIAAQMEPASGRLLIFGGESATGLKNDLLSCAVSESDDNQPVTCSTQSENDSIAPRRDAALVVNQYLHSISVLGGEQASGDGGSGQVIWTYALDKNTWENAKLAECGTPRNVDCPSGYYCGSDQTCLVGCNSDSDCATDHYCAGHTCAAFCTKDADCATGFVCREFTSGASNRMRCAALANPSCTGCICDYLDENNTAIDGCTGKTKSGCSAIKEENRNTPLWGEALLGLLLLGLPLLWWRLLRRRSPV